MWFVNDLLDKNVCTSVKYIFKNKLPANRHVNDPGLVLHLTDLVWCNAWQYLVVVLKIIPFALGALLLTIWIHRSKLSALPKNWNMASTPFPAKKSQTIKTK